ncbi:hypothetical protein PCASD_02410 [Puccinia coronata f. sp. avenae]|uniref:Uncharacterized protein n=1 Tax=Puccinia coronata f. sp. avenae TaxID=200324 RepID=A0A2N5VM63_9BASI|nr:hypothetical protein PCASD_02410 [Puccinia coronata f. sp. avenae]
MSDYHFICPISYDSPTNSRVLTLPNCPSSATLQFGPETPIPSSVTMMSSHSNSANSNNAPSSVTLRSVQSDHAHNNIQVLDVESDNIHTNPPIDQNANNQSEDENKFSGKTMKIMIGFKLFIAKKTTHKKKTWGPVNLTHNFPITVTVGETSFESFQKLVARACNNQFNNTGTIILKGLSAFPQGIFCYSHDKPAKIAQRAKMEDLLAAQALKDEASRAAKRKVTNADSEGEESEDLDDKEWDTINFYMKRLLKEHLIKAKYD